MADLRKLPPGTLPPVVLKFDASSLAGLPDHAQRRGTERDQLRDLGQYNVRNQMANVPGASVPQPFGGRYRQIMVYVDPLKLEAHQLSVMDVVRTVNDSNLILPAGDVKIGPIDYNLYTNSQLPTHARNQQPAPEDRGQRIGAGAGRRQGAGCARDSDQRRASGRPAIGVPADPEAGRRHQHDRGGERHQGSRCRPDRCSASNWSPKWCSTSRCS